MKRHATGPVKTFWLGFDIGGGYNELSDAGVVAQYFGTEHHELHVQDVDLVQTLRTLVYHYDEPFGDAASFPLYFLSEFASSHVKVVLSGDGGDELFGGYRRYVVDQLAPLKILPSMFRNNLAPALVNRLPRFRRLKRALRTLLLTQRAATLPGCYFAGKSGPNYSEVISASSHWYDPGLALHSLLHHLNGSGAASPEQVDANGPENMARRYLHGKG